MTSLCVGRPAEWWDSADDGARLAIGICRLCPTRANCLDGDPHPEGVIRGGVAYSNRGAAMNLCPTCGYPQPGELTNLLNQSERCPRCDVPSLARWRGDIDRWHEAGLSDRDAGKRLGASREQIKAVRRPRGKQLASATSGRS